MLCGPSLLIHVKPCTSRPANKSLSPSKVPKSCHHHPHQLEHPRHHQPNPITLHAQKPNQIYIYTHIHLYIYTYTLMCNRGRRQRAQPLRSAAPLRVSACVGLGTRWLTELPSIFLSEGPNPLPPAPASIGYLAHLKASILWAQTKCGGAFDMRK